jgi:DNA-binding MarR family transcriptional regulator
VVACVGAAQDQGGVTGGRARVTPVAGPVFGAAPDREAASEEVVDEVLTATRALIALSSRSLGSLAADLSTAQYRTLVVLASRGPQRMVDLAHLLAVEPSSLGRMCERLTRKGFIRRRRGRTDRRSVLISLSTQGRQVLDEATRARRSLIREALAALTIEQQEAAVVALRALSRAAGEVPDAQWPAEQGI